MSGGRGWFRSFLPRVAREGEGLAPDILSEVATQEELRRELVRASRSCRPFSVLLFQAPALPSAAGVRLSRVLLQEVRLIDRVGCFRGGRLGVLLPETSPEGALELARRVERALEAEGLGVRYDLYGGDFSEEGRGGPESPPPASSTLLLARSPREREKRALDFLGAAVGLVLLLPLFLLLALYIRLVSPGPVFFRQERLGRGGIRFVMLKFRTMHVGADTGVHREHMLRIIQGEGETTEKLDGRADPRLIPGGRLLRATCLDELPQLWNVLRGEMSLVGPRPEIPYSTEAYERWHHLRFEALPGMSGLWQVSGKERTTFRQMIQLDLRYIREQSLGMDLSILMRTGGVLLGGARSALAALFRKSYLKRTVKEPQRGAEHVYK